MEKELSEWRTKIEAYEGERRYYDTMVAMSTLTIQLYEKEIRAAFGITETERVDAGVEVEDVEKAHKDLTAAVVEAIVQLSLRNDPEVQNAYLGT